MADTAHTTDDEHADDHSSGGHSKSRYDDIPVSNVLYFGAISVVCTLLSFLFVKGLLTWFTSRYEDYRNEQIVESPASIEIENQKIALEGGDGVLSIEEASKKVLEKYGSH